MKTILSFEEHKYLHFLVKITQVFNELIETDIFLERRFAVNLLIKNLIEKIQRFVVNWKISCEHWEKNVLELFGKPVLRGIRGEVHIVFVHSRKALPKERLVD